MQILKEIRMLFGCSHCRKKSKKLEKEIVYWKEKALNFKKNHQ